MPTVIDTEYLEVNSIALSTPAWRIPDLSPLYEAPVVRGEDRLLPGEAGLLPMIRRVAARSMSFPVSVFGDLDPDGDPYSDPHVGLMTNMELLTEGLGFGVTTGDGTVDAVWHRPDGTTATADVHATGLEVVVRHEPQSLGLVLVLNVPAGVFVVNGS